MRLAVISDIHGNLAALEAVLADLRQHGADAVVNLGDCVTGPLWPKETFELLESLHFPTVRGNHDRWIAERPRDAMVGSMRFTYDALSEGQRVALGHLPAMLETMDDVLAVHGTPDDDCAYLLEESVEERLRLRSTQSIATLLGARRQRLVLCGHSHLQHSVWASGARLIVNPGSVGCPRYADNPDPVANEAGSPHARYAIAERRKERWSVQMHVLDYDWTPVVDRAKVLGRSDWAAAFLKGGESV